MASEKELYYLGEHGKSAEPAYLRRLLGPLSIAPGSTVVDIGCGTAYVNSYLARELRLAGNFGFDLDLDAIRLARRLNPDLPSQPWFCASAEHIPLLGGSVDHAICRVVLPYCDIPRVIREISRIVRPGGTVALVLHPWYFYLRWLSLRPGRWKSSAQAIAATFLSAYFNLTGRHLALRWHGISIGQTGQTVARMRRILRRHQFDLYQVVRRPELAVYARRS